MDEPGHDRPQTDDRQGVLPALILLWAAGYLVVGSLMATFRDAAWTRSHPEGAVKIHAVALGMLALLFLHALARARPAPREAGEPEAWLCQHCLKPYVPGAHFCPRCGAPKTFYSGVSPYERAHAQAWILGKAAHHPSRALHVVALTATGVTQGLGLITLAWTGLPPLGLAGTWSWLAYAWVALWILEVCLFLALTAYCWRAWLRRVREQPPIRPEIEYGCPPWFSFDAEWALPEFEEEPEGGEPEPTPAAG